MLRVREVRYKCAICGRQFSSAERLKEHVKSHLGGVRAGAR